jgi:hypothetical protein
LLLLRFKRDIPPLVVVGDDDNEVVDDEVGGGALLGFVIGDDSTDVSPLILLLKLSVI